MSGELEKVMIDKRQIKRIHTLLPIELKEDEDAKASLIVQFTEDNSKTSTKDLEYHQAEELIYFLAKGEQKTYAHYAAFNAKNKQHMRILSQAQSLGWVVYNEKLGRNVADLERLGRWIAAFSKYKTPIRRLKEAELSKVIYQLQNLIKYEYAKQDEPKIEI